MKKIFQILFASSNAGKFGEVQAVAAEYAIRVINPQVLFSERVGDDDRIAELANPPQVEENAESYLGNARLKAEAFYRWSAMPSLADDTGLEVAALDNQPGVYSARYAGADGDSGRNIEKLLRNLKNIQDRKAVFRCVICLCYGKDQSMTAEGFLAGEITCDPRGFGGFGYDSVFYLPSYGKTLAEIKEEGINVVTHRVLACRELFSRL